MNQADPETRDETGQVTRAREGDREAQGWLIDRHQDAVYGLAQRLVGGDPDRAEDLAQEAFLRALRALPRFRGECAFSTWMHRIVVNLHINRESTLRARAERGTLSLGPSQDDGRGRGPVEVADERVRDPREAAELQEVSSGLKEALHDLSDERRTVVVLRDLMGWSYEEIASEVGVPIGTVRSRLFRAREDLRRRWKELKATALGESSNAAWAGEGS